MNAGVMVVLATLAAVALWVVAAAVVEAVRRRRGRAQTLRAQLLLDEHARAWASRAAVAGASAHRLADLCDGSGQPQNVAAAGDLPDDPAAAATHERQAS